jgi:hypothetical protein
MYSFRFNSCIIDKSAVTVSIVLKSPSKLRQSTLQTEDGSLLLGFVVISQQSPNL